MPGSSFEIKHADLQWPNRGEDTSSQSPPRPSQHICFLKYGFQTLCLKMAHFPKTLERTTTFRSWHRNAGCWPARRAEGPHTGVPKILHPDLNVFTDLQRAIVSVSQIQKKRLPANHNTWKRFSCDLIKQTHLLIKQITGSGILILCSNKGLDV